MMNRHPTSTLSCFLCILLLASVACATSKQETTHSEKENAAATSDAYCEKDSDCVLVPADCCGCNQGGKQRAINKKSVATNAKKRKESCEHTVCIQMISKDPSCKATSAACVKNLCTYNH